LSSPTTIFITSTKRVSKTSVITGTIELRRAIKIAELRGITKNLQEKSKEIVIHVRNEPDYRLTCE